MMMMCDVNKISDEAFQEQCFLWEKRAPTDMEFGLFNFKDLLHAK